MNKKTIGIFILILFFIVSIFPSLSGIKTEEIEIINNNRNIMLTGYWNPTGQMIAEFSTDLYLNPDGWKGENWENLGYDIYSFFPTPYTYNGTFEVDYQNTWDDFWTITAEINPIAIISYGAGAGPWEIEYNARNLDSWVPDSNPPYQPTPCPPDDSKPTGYERHSTIPVQKISDAVNEQTNVNAWIDWNGNPGAYLCEYIAYLGMWYQDIHNDTGDPYRCYEAGFIHVISSLALEDAKKATKVTIREVIKFLPNNSNNPPETPTITGPTNGGIDTPLTFTFNSIDPDGDDVEYYIRWGDGHVENWDGPHVSEEDVNIPHTYTSEGSFTIEAKARDTFGEEGNWGNLTITIPRDKATNNPFLNFLQSHPNLFPLLQKLILNLGLF
jgi:pyrrolidone-carboxylate peptidase